MSRIFLGPYTDFEELDLTSATYPLELTDATHQPRARGATSRIEIVTAGGGALNCTTADGTTANLTGLAAGWTQRLSIVALTSGTSVSRIRVYWG